MRPVMKPVAAMLVAGVALSLAGCASTESRRINLGSYAPVVDVKGQGYDVATYYADLDECRFIGMKVQADYEQRYEQEKREAFQAAAIGVAVGAALGSAIGQHNDQHSGRALTEGALIGGALGASVGSDQIDYDRTMARFGATAVVDRCMQGRGYTVLSAEGRGGG